MGVSSGGATPLVDVGDIRREAVGGRRRRRRLAPPLGVSLTPDVGGWNGAIDPNRHSRSESDCLQLILQPTTQFTTLKHAAEAVSRLRAPSTGNMITQYAPRTRDGHETARALQYSK
ncbi:hypothetical protein EVAR_46592_1 [Eumeta japonica]|uniref:Uncharacterized protein n=1 Tax=Eumeta variegata TaxID=151549 RepID=A0A4C1WTB6_EUMVA|nr:hypothetical protein EVAR_46592_1 [Eumeta japonica]